MRNPNLPAALPKYQQIVDDLTAGIASGQWVRGQKLPSEAMLVKRYATSRITVGRALRELQQHGLIERIAGSGSYVHGGPQDSQFAFGLLIPDLGETEIFEPICRGIANAPRAGGHALLWGHSDAAGSANGQQALQLCQQYMDRKVNGVFFAPLEFEENARQVNRRILLQLAEAKIPVVLLDRRPADAPEQGRPDLVGINNRQAGYIATEHLIKLGCRKIGFMAYHGSEATINARFAGYRDALLAHGLHDEIEALGHRDGEKAAVEPLEAYVCINDRVAGQLMHAFLSSNLRIPDDIRIVGIDDVSYASLLPVPLTTVRQPCQAIGEAALATMLDRIDRPYLPARDVLLDGELIVRKSCGASTPVRSA
jgi:GntR family transcriptional regulator, arabinose operon transcriptional repressor